MEQNPAYRLTPADYFQHGIFMASFQDNPLSKQETWAVILAAGSGSRMGAALDRPKQFLSLAGRPLYWHSAIVMAASAIVDGIVFVFPAAVCETERERVAALASRDNLGLPWLVAPGGERRQDSCANGLARAPDICQKVLIHDAARPFVTARLVRRVCEAISPATPCVVPALSVTDTIKILTADSTLTKDRMAPVDATLPRSRLVACQTPQGFWLPSLREALSHNNENVTDEAALMEKSGFATMAVAGEAANVKVTTPEDLRLLENKDPNALAWLPACGMGYDAHRVIKIEEDAGIGKARPLKLGGVSVSEDIGVLARSDGDILLHALMDALLGMAALGDIGGLFPDTDERYEGISSAILLERVMELVREKEIHLTQLDLTVVAQKPKLAPFANAIKKNVARLASLDPSSVNFKATTEEGMGFTGSCAGIKAYALATGIKPNPQKRR